MGQCGPEQIHLAATTSPSSVIITWVYTSPKTYIHTSWIIFFNKASPEPCDMSSFVYYSKSSTQHYQATATCSIFNESNPNGLHYYHQANLLNLDESTKYFYFVSSSNLNSSIHSFKTLSSNPDWVPNLLIYGDLGHNGGAVEHELFTALPSITRQVQSGSVDLIFHAGDFAYDLYVHFLSSFLHTMHSNKFTEIRMVEPTVIIFSE